MKRCLAVLLACILLAGCSGQNSELNRAMSIREELLGSNGCEFDAVITADYGEKVYTFGMHCLTDANGNLTFSVSDPQTIAGITGVISEEGGKLTFDDTALAFETLADGRITPVSASWLLIHTLRSGYLTSAGADGEYLRIQIDDSYADNALHLDIWTDQQDHPVRGEILWQGQRIISIDVRNFVYV